MLSKRPELALAPLAILLAGALASPPAGAHEVPGDVTVQVLVRPEGERLLVAVRVPVEAMQEVGIPVTGQGMLDLAATRRSEVLADAASLWIGDNLEVQANGEPLPILGLAAVRVSLPSDRSFSSWESALDHLHGEPLPETLQIPWQQAMLDALFEGAIPSEDAALAIRPRFERLGLRVRTALTFLPPDGAARAYELHGDPGLVRLDPRWHQAAARFVELGFFHILGGIDHLLFIGCLVIPLRRLRELVLVVTSFTVAHSVTLIAAALGLAPDALWFPALVELAIAASIVWMAFENILGVGARRRWVLTFGFGLVHGFGFSFALRETLQFAGSHLVTSLLAFNLGVELGQVFVLVLLVPVLDLLLRRVVAERIGIVLLSALIAHTAWHWMTERASTLGQYRIDWPLIDAIPPRALPWLALVVVLAVPAWRALREARGGSRDRDPQRPAERPPVSTSRPPIHTE
ncbi:MAG TPA: HupE/UreJ family protein [Thermoanaerobaculia bacterium]|nr:HupE/UreJ family protein [Thermoanaerobaculia bacterium]